MDSGYTHVVEYDGGAMVDQITRYPDRNRFLSPLRRRNGDTRWALTLWPLPEGMSYDDAEHLPGRLLAGGGHSGRTDGGHPQARRRAVGL